MYQKKVKRYFFIKMVLYYDFDFQFVIGGIVMELDKMSKAQQSSAGSRMAQETSIFWLKIALLVAESCPSDAIPKLIQIIARLANAGFRNLV